MSRARILIIEDNAGDVFIVNEALREHGIDYESLVAHDGEEALRLIDSIANGSERAPDVVLLDLNLPRHTGAELLNRLQRTQSMSGVPIIVMTSSDSPKDRAVATSSGAAVYFRKPSDLDEFLRLGRLVKELLAKRAAT